MSADSGSRPPSSPPSRPDLAEAVRSGRSCRRRTIEPGINRFGDRSSDVPNRELPIGRPAQGSVASRKPLSGLGLGGLPRSRMATCAQLRLPAAQRAGIEGAKQHGDRAYLGREPSYTR